MYRVAKKERERERDMCVYDEYVCVSVCMCVCMCMSVCRYESVSMCVWGDI